MTRPLLSLALLAAIVPWGAALAAQADHVAVSNAWIRLLPGELPAGAYATLKNSGTAEAVLTGAHSDQFGSVMLHQSVEMGGSSMMMTANHLSVPAHGQASLMPGAYHLMLMKPLHAANVGDTVTIVLDFADGSHLSTPFKVRAANADPNG